VERRSATASSASRPPSTPYARRRSSSRARPAPGSPAMRMHRHLLGSPSMA